MGKAEASRARRRTTITLPGAGFLVLGIALGVLLIGAGNRVYALQGGVSDLASYVPLGYAFAAGMVATANPCGILLLPSLVAYYLGGSGGDKASGWARVERALQLSLMATLGFVLLFAVVGVIVGAGGGALAAAFPLGGLIVGVALVGLGGWLALTGEGFGVAAFGRAMGRVRLSDDPRSLFAFGVGYALCSLSCTLPIFLVVAGSALATRSVVAATAQFVGYALGMGAVLSLVILAAAFFQRAVARSLRVLVPYVHRLAASFLLGAGVFMIHYWLAALGFL